MTDALTTVRGYTGTVSVSAGRVVREAVPGGVQAWRYASIVPQLEPQGLCQLYRACRSSSEH